MQVHSDHRGAIAAQGQRDRRHSLGESVAPEWPRIWLEESHRVQDKAGVPVTDTARRNQGRSFGIRQQRNGRLLVWRMLNA